MRAHHLLRYHSPKSSTLVEEPHLQGHHQKNSTEPQAHQQRQREHLPDVGYAIFHADLDFSYQSQKNEVAEIQLLEEVSTATKKESLLHFRSHTSTRKNY